MIIAGVDVIADQDEVHQPRRLSAPMAEVRVYNLTARAKDKAPVDVTGLGESQAQSLKRIFTADGYSVNVTEVTR